MVPDIVVLNKNLLYYFKNKVTNMRRPVAGTHKCSWSAQSLPSPRPARGSSTAMRNSKFLGKTESKESSEKSQLALLPKGAEANAAQQKLSAFFRTFFSDSWQLWLQVSVFWLSREDHHSLLGEWTQSFGLGGESCQLLELVFIYRPLCSAAGLKHCFPPIFQFSHCCQDRRHLCRVVYKW